MKWVIITLILLLNTCLEIFSQNCYNIFYSEGKKAYAELNFEKALNQFDAAKICDDIPPDSDIDEWITKAKNGYIIEILEARAKAEKEKKVALEALKKAEEEAAVSKNAALTFKVAKYDPTLSVRIAEYNKSKYPNNPIATTSFLEIYEENNLYYKESIEIGSSSIDWVFPVITNRNTILSSSGNTPTLWDITGHKLLDFKGHKDKVYSVSISTERNLVVSGDSIGVVKLWDLKGNEQVSFIGHDSSIYSIAFSPDGEKILTGSQDHTAKLWDLKGNELTSFDHDDYVLSVAFSPDGEKILTGSADYTARIWDLQGNELAKFDSKYYTSSVRTLDFSPDGKLVLIGYEEGMAILWDLLGSEPIYFDSDGDNEVIASSFSTLEEKILIGYTDGTAKLWDYQGNKLVSFECSKEGVVYGVMFSPNEKKIFTVCSDGTIKLWDYQGNELISFEGPKNGSIKGISFSLDGNSILIGNADGRISKWDLQGNELENLQIGDPDVYSMAFSQSNESVIIMYNNQTIRRYDLHGNTIEIYEGFCPDQKYIYTVSWVAMPPDLKKILTIPDDEHYPKLWLTPQAFLDQEAHKFSLQELFDVGVILTGEDKKSIDQK